MKITGLLLLTLLVIFVSFDATATPRSIFARTALQPPVIDGQLNDSVWRDTPFFSDFTQQSPNPLTAPSESTETAVAYDHTYLYVAIRCEATEPGTIRSRFTRRDRDGDFDKVEVLLSPTNDGKTGFSFIANPDGIQQDGAWSNDTTFDRNWDAVWQVATISTDSFWTAEFAIPLDQLRFYKNTPHFGFQITRWIAHRHQLVVFNPKHPDDAGIVSRIGRLSNTQSIAPPLPFSTTPEIYASYTTKNADMESTSPQGTQFGAGGYIRAGVAPGWTLDLAISPDFGEIEVDKAVVNLSNVEPMYAEKRPFFLENRQLFITPLQLFYSRRLGEAPTTPDVADNETVIAGPLHTPILLATKLSGTSDNGFSLGALHVLSEPTRFSVQNQITEDTLLDETSPWTHDSVFRLGKQFKHGNNIGLLTTSHLPTNHEDRAHTSGLDWNLFWADKEYALKGQVAASAVQEETDDRTYDSGTAAWFWLGRQGGRHFRASAQYDFRSNDFDISHLGYLDRNDLHKLTYHAQFLINEQRRYLYELYTGVQFFFAWNTEGRELQKQTNAYLSIKWRNRMWTHLGGYGKLPAYDDMEFNDGPALHRIRGGGMWVGLLTAEDLPLGFRFDGNLGTDDTGYYYILKPALALRTGRVELELNYRFVQAHNRESYADTLEFDTHNEYILSKRNLIEMETGLKSTVVLLKNFTAELTSQLLTSKAHYHDFRQLHEDSHVSQTNYDDSPDFGTTVLILQALLRYEFRPQSVLYLSYMHRGEGDVRRNPYTLSRTMDTIDKYAEHRFLVKISYRF